MYRRGAARPDAHVDHWTTDITEIIPFHEFGELTEPGLCSGAPFAIDGLVLSAPELDDLNDLTYEPPLLLLSPTGESPVANQSRTRVSAPQSTHKPQTSLRSAKPTTHRGSPPSHRKTSYATGAAHSRLMIAAIASGAVAAGANAAVEGTVAQSETVLSAAATSPTSAGYGADTRGLQIVPVAGTFDSMVHQQELVNGAAFAQERAQREARLRRPQFVFPTQGIVTSGFGMRWGTLHGGLDIANAVGTPIYAASDGEVIASGPTPGFGMWVKIRAADGTVTLYGHIDTTTVQTGERVMAGDQIATMGNRGNSTGPHLHFEVHRNGFDKTDPTAWLQERGVSKGL